MGLSINLFIEMGAKEEHLQGDLQLCLFPREVGNFDLIFITKMRSFCAHRRVNFLNYSQGGGGVQGQRLMSIFALNDYIWLATCQSKIYKK